MTEFLFIYFQVMFIWIWWFIDLNSPNQLLRFTKFNCSTSQIANMDIQVVQSYTTHYFADSVEWCPIPSYERYLVCGTYELKESATFPSRLGQLNLFSVSEVLELKLHYTEDTDGILDIKWCPQIINGYITLAAATAKGDIVIWKFETDDQRLNQISKFAISDDENNIALSLDWFVSNDVKICISDSTGFIRIIQVTENKKFTMLYQCKAHAYEAWIAIFDQENDCIIYSGGDDCKMNVYDFRSGLNPHFKLTEHTAGVTSLRFNHISQHILASGSYDETIKLWDNRNIRQSVSSTEVGGGIWRIKWEPKHATIILTASMYSGAHLLDSSNKDHPRIITHFTEHGSITYGADFSRLDSEAILNNESNKSAVGLIATCSFYDNKLLVSLLHDR